MVHFKLVIFSELLVTKVFWCGDIKSERPALGFTLLNIIIVEIIGVVCSLTPLVLAQLPRHLAMCRLVPGSFSQSSSVWPVWPPALSVLSCTNTESHLLDSLSVPGVVMWADICHYNLSDLKTLCLVIVRAKPWSGAHLYQSALMVTDRERQHRSQLRTSRGTASLFLHCLKLPWHLSGAVTKETNKLHCLENVLFLMDP